MGQWETGGTLYDMRILDKMRCPPEERRELFPLVERFLELSRAACEKGVLVLDLMVKGSDSPLMRKGIELVCDGTDPDIIRWTMYCRSLCGGAAGRELFRNIVTTEGVLAIQQGSHPLTVRDVLLALFGDDMIDEARAYFKDDRKALRREVAGRLAATADRTAAEPFTLLEEAVAALSEQEASALVRSQGFRDLYRYDSVAAVANASGKTIAKLVGAMPLRQAFLFIDSYGFKPGIPSTIPDEAWRKRWTDSVVATQKKTLELIQRFK